MPGGAGRAVPPVEYAVRGVWPRAVMHPYRGAQVAQAIARALSEAMAAQSLSANELAKRSGVNRQVIANVLAGTTWPDLITIANLEAALGATLWPDHNAWDNAAPVPSPPLPRKPRDPAS